MKKKEPIKLRKRRKEINKDGRDIGLELHVRKNPKVSCLCLVHILSMIYWLHMLIADSIGYNAQIGRMINISQAYIHVYKQQLDQI